jgi:uncharacterized protein (DUF1501 family)
VVVWGEFGRTPKIHKNAGRDHGARVNSALLFGGGMRVGQVIVRRRIFTTDHTEDTDGKRGTTSSFSASPLL